MRNLTLSFCFLNDKLYIELVFSVTLIHEILRSPLFKLNFNYLPIQNQVPLEFLLKILSIILCIELVKIHFMTIASCLYVTHVVYSRFFIFLSKLNYLTHIYTIEVQ